MARINADLLEKLQTKLGVKRARAYQLVQEHANEQVLPPDLAALSLAMRNGINVTRYSTKDQLAEIRHAVRGGPPSPTAVPPPTVEAPKRAARTARNVSPVKSRTGRTAGKAVFVIHGRNEKVRRAMFDMLRGLGLSPMEFGSLISKTRKGSPHISDALEAALASPDAVVVLMTPDDEAVLKKELQRRDDPAYEKRPTGQPRPNVLFEAGMAFGRHPNKTIIVHVGKIRPFSDVLGRHYIKLTSDAKGKWDLARRLQTAGCKIDTSGDDWLDDGGAFAVK